MYAFGTPLFIKDGFSNINARWQVNAQGEPDSTKAGVYVGGVYKTIPRGFAGFATTLRRDGYLLLHTASSYQGAVIIDGYWMKEDYLTDKQPKGFSTSEAQAVAASQAVFKKATGDYGITASWGSGGFDLPDWLKGIPGLLLLAGTVYAATRKNK